MTKNLYHGILLVLPNLLNPYKLYKNLRHPIHEMVHTKHIQYPMKGNRDLHVVEHEFFGRLVTVDLIERDKSINSILDLYFKLFRADFYYGHCEYFSEPFRLIHRHYINHERRLKSIVKGSKTDGQ